MFLNFSNEEFKKAKVKLTEPVSHLKKMSFKSFAAQTEKLWNEVEKIAKMKENSLLKN